MARRSAGYARLFFKSVTNRHFDDNLFSQSQVMVGVMGCIRLSASPGYAHSAAGVRISYIE